MPRHAGPNVLGRRGQVVEKLKLMNDLIDSFIQGVELDAEKVIDGVCEKFPQVMEKNHKRFKLATAHLRL